MSSLHPWHACTCPRPPHLFCSLQKHCSTVPGVDSAHSTCCIRCWHQHVILVLAAFTWQHLFLGKTCCVSGVASQSPPSNQAYVWSAQPSAGHDPFLLAPTFGCVSPVTLLAGNVGCFADWCACILTSACSYCGCCLLSRQLRHQYRHLAQCYAGCCAWWLLCGLQHVLPAGSCLLSYHTWCVKAILALFMRFSQTDKLCYAYV